MEQIQMSRVKEILFDYKFIDTNIEVLSLELEMIRDSKGELSAVQYDDMPRSAKISKPTENAVISSIEDSIYLTSEINKLRLRKKVIESTYNTLDSYYKSIFDLLYRDVTATTVSVICRQLCVGKDKFYNDKNKILLLFQKMFTKHKRLF